MMWIVTHCLAYNAY